MSTNHKSKGLKGRDLISIGIYSAIYFVINFACMLISGFHPLIWILMPALIGLLGATPYMLMCSKVKKPGAVLIMGLIVGLIYFVTGQFTIYIMIAFVIGCVLAELFRYLTTYGSFFGNTLAFAGFSLGMIGSPLPIWVMRESFFAQITEQGMSQDYVDTLAAVSSNGMLVVMIVATVLCALAGAAISKGLFKKHFAKAGVV